MKRWINDISFSRKLATIVVAALVPIALLAFFFVRSEQQTIAAAQVEQLGLSAHDPLVSVLGPLADAQLWAVAAAQGEASAKSRWQEARAQVERLLDERTRATGDYGAPAGEDARRWAEIRSAWSQLVALPLVNSLQINEGYTAFGDRIVEMNAYVMATSGVWLGFRCSAEVAFTRTPGGVVTPSFWEHRAGDTLVAAVEEHLCRRNHLRPSPSRSDGRGSPGVSTPGPRPCPPMPHGAERRRTRLDAAPFRVDVSPSRVADPPSLRDGSFAMLESGISFALRG